MAIRTICAEDAGALNDFHEHLSDETVYKRFLGPHRHLRPQEVDWFTHVDNDTRLALVAQRQGRLLGVARYDAGPDKSSAEVAFVVADELQGRGLGMLLLEHLAAAGRRRGIPTFTADTLCSNTQMRTVFRHAGFACESNWCSKLVQFSFPITPSQPYLEAVLRRQCAAARAWADRIIGPVPDGDVIALCASKETSAALTAAARRVGLSLGHVQLPVDPSDGLAAYLGESSGRPIIVDLEGLQLPRRFLALARVAAGDRRLVGFDPNRRWRRMCHQAGVQTTRWAGEAVAKLTQLRSDEAEWGVVPDGPDCDVTTGRQVLDNWWSKRGETPGYLELPPAVRTDLLGAYRIREPSPVLIRAGDTGGPLAIRTFTLAGRMHRLLPLTDHDAFELAGSDSDLVLRVARLLDDQPDVREIQLGPDDAPRILVGTRRGTVDDPWVRRWGQGDA